MLGYCCLRISLLSLSTSSTLIAVLEPSFMPGWNWHSPMSRNYARVGTSGHFLWLSCKMDSTLQQPHHHSPSLFSCVMMISNLVYLSLLKREVLWQSWMTSTRLMHGHTLHLSYRQQSSLNSYNITLPQEICIRQSSSLFASMIICAHCLANLHQHVTHYPKALLSQYVQCTISDIRSVDCQFAQARQQLLSYVTGWCSYLLKSSMHNLIYLRSFKATLMRDFPFST